MCSASLSGALHPVECSFWAFWSALLLIGAALYLALFQPPPAGLERSADGVLQVPSAVPASDAAPTLVGASPRGPERLNGPQLEIPELGIRGPYRVGFERSFRIMASATV